MTGNFGPGVLRTDSGRTYLIGEAIGLAPEPGSECDAARFGSPPTMLGDRCRCTVCPRCHHHTGNAHQGHHWGFCKVTRTVREPHLCCPDPEFGCELDDPVPAVPAEGTTP